VEGGWGGVAVAPSVVGVGGGNARGVHGSTSLLCDIFLQTNISDSWIWRYDILVAVTP
ncbi:hypothetical protein A2U01_0085450, partial [Trifolium medium]|nr:hypothetical protein [Trifolium medium]